MLDTFEILTTSGVVLWRKSYAPVKASVVNSLINDVFIEGRRSAGSSTVTNSEDSSAARNAAYKKDRYTIKWSTAKDLGLIFVVSRLNWRLELNDRNHDHYTPHMDKALQSVSSLVATQQSIPLLTKHQNLGSLPESPSPIVGG